MAALCRQTFRRCEPRLGLGRGMLRGWERRALPAAIGRSPGLAGASLDPLCPRVAGRDRARSALGSPGARPSPPPRRGTPPWGHPRAVGAARGVPAASGTCGKPNPPGDPIPCGEWGGGSGRAAAGSASPRPRRALLRSHAGSSDLPPHMLFPSAAISVLHKRAAHRDLIKEN